MFQPCPIRGVIQNYAWGLTKEAALVAKLAELNVPGSTAALPENASYAELWFATHPNGQSRVIDAAFTSNGGVTLQEYLGGEPLPYIFKVLSIRQALSIQAHPDQVVARDLHKLRPDLYKDPNHKPEQVLALTPMDALCGFRSLREIAFYANNIPPFAALLSAETRNQLESYIAGSATEAKRDSKQAECILLRAIFSETIASSDAENVQKQITALYELANNARARGESAFPELPFPASMGHRAMNAKRLTDLIVDLSQQYPGDVGCFCPFVLNCFTLQPGESVFLAPNVPHAYLSGQCVEVMACSDNVIRAGLTPKFRDVETLLRILDYRSVPPVVDTGATLSPGLKMFNPPAQFPEFMVFEVHSSSDQDESKRMVQLPVLDEGAILLCTDGRVALTMTSPTGDTTEAQISAGAAWFIPKGTQVELAREGDKAFTCYVCTTNQAAEIKKRHSSL